LAWRAVGGKSPKDALARSDEILGLQHPSKDRHLGSPTRRGGAFLNAFKKSAGQG
jgi:hypothetical protein